MSGKRPLPILLVAACALIALVGWFGWNAKRRPATEAPQPSGETINNQESVTAREPQVKPPATDELEALQLRREVTSLRQERKDLLKLQEENAKLREQLAAATTNRNEDEKEQPSQEEQAMREAGIAKMNFTRTWCLAFSLYAQQNQGEMPASFEQARVYLSEQPNSALNPDQFEIVFKGSLQDLQQSKVHKAQDIIVLREREPVTAPDGTRSKAYAFADGHSEVRREPPEGFEQWEKGRIFAGGPLRE